MKIRDYTFPETLLYDLEHSYVYAADDQQIVQGVTDLGQALVGDILFVELPFVGRRVQQGERLLSIQPMDPHGKVVRLHAGVSGEIIGINPALEDAPDLPNNSPYGDGWLLVIRPDNVAELDNLYRADAPELAAWVDRELEAMHLHEMRIGRQVSGRPAPVPDTTREDTIMTSIESPKALPRITYSPNGGASSGVATDGARVVARYTFPAGLHYDASHSYASYDEKAEVVVQGLTDLGQGLLGEALFVELPYVGRTVRQGDTLLTIQPLTPGREMRRLTATVSGEVVAVNEALSDDPTPINGAPYKEGWLVQIRPVDVTELDDLWTAGTPALEDWAWEEMERALPPMEFLKEWFGERAQDTELEKHLYSRDLAPVPPLLASSLGLRTEPDVIVRPHTAQEVSRIMRTAARHNIPVTPRASASTVYFNTVPSKGGLLLDLNDLRGEPVLNEAHGTVTVGPAVRWKELDDWLRARGWAAKSYPTSAPSATVGGWVAMEGYGIGSLYFGCVHEHVVRLEVVLPNGEIVNVTRASNPPLSWFTGSEGTTGIITEIELSVRPTPMAEGHHVLIFPNREVMAEAARLLANSEPRPYNMHFADASYHQILADGGFSVPAIKPGLSVDYDGDAATIEAGAHNVAQIVARVGGEEMSADVARHEWNTRFWALRSKRQGPSVLAAEVWLPIENLARFIRDVERFGRSMGITMYNYGTVVAPGYVTAFAMYRANEGSIIDYMLSLSVTKRLHDIGKRHGGHPYGIGLWNAAYLKDIFSDKTIAELRNRKQQLDPTGILNPGKIYQTLTLLPRPLFQFGMGSLSLVRGLTTRILGEPPKPDVPAAEPVHGKEEHPAYAGLLEEAMICAQCGYCRSICPIYSSLGWESTAPRGKIAATKKLARRWNGHGPADSLGTVDEELLEEFVHRLYQCTLCGACAEVCPTRIDLRSMWLDLRQRFAEAGLAPENFNMLKDSIEANHNILNEPNDNRLIWAEQLDDFPAELVGKQNAEVAYYVGCVSSLFPMANDIPRSMVKIMQKAGIDFTVLGGEEWCCGFPLIGAGMPDQAREMALHNVERMKALGVKRVVASCPSCFHVWAHEYEKWTGEPLPFEVVHSTEMLAEIVESGTVPMVFDKGKVTYHDPCDLGRTSGIYEAPRRAIQGVEGAELVEMAYNREQAVCCGGGGNLEMVDSDLVKSISARKIQLALDTEAGTVVTACQQCKRTMTAAARAQKARLRVLDLTEFLWAAIEAGEREATPAGD